METPNIFFFFFKSSKLNLTCILTCAEELKSTFKKVSTCTSMLTSGMHRRPFEGRHLVLHCDSLYFSIVSSFSFFCLFFFIFGLFLFFFIIYSYYFYYIYIIYSYFIFISHEASNSFLGINRRTYPIKVSIFSPVILIDAFFYADFKNAISFGWSHRVFEL